VALIYKFLKVIEQYLIFRQESLVDVLNFIVRYDDDAILRVIKNTLEQVLSVNAISYDSLELFDPVSVNINIKHQKDSQNYHVEKMFFVALHRLMLIESLLVEKNHYLKVLKDGHSRKIVILSNDQDQCCDGNGHHD